MANSVNRQVNITANTAQANNNLAQTTQQLTRVTQATQTATAAQQRSTQATQSATQAVVQNGGAVGLLDRVTGGLATTFRDAGEAIGLAGGSLRTFGGILAATGIGVLLLIVTYWDDISEAISGAGKELDKYNRNMAISKRDVDEKNEALEQTNAIAEASGKKDQELYDIRKKNIEAEIANIQTLNDKLTDRINSGIEAEEREKIQEEKEGNYSKMRQLQNSLEVEGVKLKTKLTEDAANAAQKIADDAKKANDELNKRETARLDTLTKINTAIKEQLNALLKTNQTDESTKAAESLNGQYVAINKIIEARDKLDTQVKEARELAAKETAQQAGLENSQTKQLEKILESRVSINAELVKQANLIVGETPKTDESSERLNIIKKNGEAEIAAINGFQMDALALRRQAFQMEAKLTEDALTKQLNKDKELREEAINKAAKLDADASEKNVLERAAQHAIINDLTKKFNADQAALNAVKQSNDSTNNAYDVEGKRLATEEKLRIENEYIDRVQIINQNLGGFLSALQNEQIIRSKDLRNVALVAEKGIAIAGVVIDTIRTNKELTAASVKETAAAAASFAAYDYVGGAAHTAAAGAATAGIGLNTAASGIAVAGILATTLTSWNRSAGGSGGGGSAPAANFNIVGTDGNNQLASTIAAQQNQPLQAYIVGSDINTYQELERNRIVSQTFLG